MTRINTNISSLTAQNSLQRSNDQLQTALTRLSTGLRINVGKDDPAGLIASEALKSDITSVTKAISNSERANEMIATADSALGQVSDLLNDVRGLVTEAANTGAMSADQIAANQLQVDSSLDAINRIAQVTSFQGRRLLDGSLDFTTAAWTGDSSKVTDLQINQANLGSGGSLAVDVEITTAATKGTIGAATGDAGVKAYGTITFQDDVAGSNTLRVTAPGAGTGSNGIRLEVVEDADTLTTAPTATYDSQAGKITIKVADSGTTAISDIEDAIESTGFTVAQTAGTGTVYDADSNVPAGVQASTTIEFADGTTMDLTASTLIGTAGNVQVHFIEDAGTLTTAPTAAWNAGANRLDITVNDAGTTTASKIAAAINAEATGAFTAEVSAGAGGYVAGDDAAIGVAAKAATITKGIAGTDLEMTFTAREAGTDANAYSVKFIEDGTAVGSPQALMNGNVLEIHVNSGADTTIAAIAAAVNTYGTSESPFTLTYTGTDANYEHGQAFALEGISLTTTSAAATKAVITHAITGVDASVVFTARNAGVAANQYTVKFIEDAGTLAGSPTAAMNGTELEITVNDTNNTNLSDIINAVNDYGTSNSPFTMSVTGTGLVYDPTQAWAGTSLAVTDAGNTMGQSAITSVAGEAEVNGVDMAASGGLNAVSGVLDNGTGAGDLVGPVVFQVTGSRGSQVFSFDTGTTAAQIATALIAASDAIGVTGSASGSNLTFSSVDYGSEGSVRIDVISDVEGSFTASLTATRDAGDDISGSINGVAATGRGTTLSVNSATLSMNITFDGATSADGDSTTFAIDGGGALFQLGPDVTTGQQARIGIQSVNSATLGGTSGRLYTLGSGEENELASDPTTAAAIVDEVITKVTSLRGRLGAFQKATLESNIASLTDTQENLTAAQSAIRDADFAAESANLTRAQILVQSGTSVLSIANQNPQNVLSLLR